MHDILVRPPTLMADVEAEIDRLVFCDQSLVTDATRYHLSAGGARVRAQLGLDAAVVLNLSRTASLACAAAPELLHNASLVHDDLQDGDALRRAKPAVWKKFGRAVALSTGDLLISAAYAALAAHPHPGAALRAMHEAIAITIRGQTQGDHDGHPSPDAYAAIAADKSGPLLALPVRLALIAANAPGEEAALRAGRGLALAYQTLDDLADRHADRARGSTNICLSLEAAGHTPATAAATARSCAHAALDAARREAMAIPGDAGAPFLGLADRLETQLKELADAA
ncbi:MAG: polyprenyl synthetase family protein [Pseudorhodobacter sp.]|nr:polyprenyl synthetase family protein [Pseudorhodobacter sp.]